MTQERDRAVIWAQDMQDHHMDGTVGGDDDFTKFLDLDGDFQQFAEVNHGHSGLDTPMGRLGFGNSATDLTFAGAESMNMTSNPPSTEAVDYAGQMAANRSYGQYDPYQQMQMAQQYHIPPTPVSAEMQAAKYAHQVGNNGQMLFDHRQVSFTPLVSPAQTPLDATFNMPDYGLADDFFSPLTSPAIEAQVGYGGTGATASPVDLNTEAGTPGTSTAAGAKRPRNKANAASRTPGRGVKQSPSMKPQSRRRHPSLASLHLDKAAVSSRAGSTVPVSAPNSTVILPSDVSTSPESLSDAVMRPPPLPQPDSAPPSTMAPHTAASNNPVTPATLMRMPSNSSLSTKHMLHHGAGLGADADEPMEDIMLPDPAAAAAQTPAARIDVAKVAGDDSEGTPTLSAKTAKLTPASTPRGSLARGPSVENFSKPAKVDARGGGRANKKRQSTSSAAISPALRPKISPSISPLVPAPGPGLAHLSAETSALYLASKSNYQNILEGTHLPGVSYPETLAENLTSKRTSHKIAEQGRRNRINLALKEIESLLPSSILAATAKKEKAAAETEDGEAKSSGAGQGASKASTVEMAIIYIKSLQSELAETKNKLDVAEKKLAEGSSSADSQASDG